MDLTTLLNWRSPWFWIVVVGGGALVAFVILPKIRGGSLGTPSTATSSGPSGGTGQTQPSTVYVVDETQYTPPGGIAGAVPPTTGTDSSATGVPTTAPQAPTPVPQPAPNPTPAPAAPAPVTPVTPVQTPPQTPPQPPQQFIYPSAWPSQTSTLSGIAQRYGVALSALESFPENQYIRNRSPQGWDLIYTTDRIRVS